jgi:hypothetical protein
VNTSFVLPLQLKEYLTHAIYIGNPSLSQYSGKLDLTAVKHNGFPLNEISTEKHE